MGAMFTVKTPSLLMFVAANRSCRERNLVQVHDASHIDVAKQRNMRLVWCAKECRQQIAYLALSFERELGIGFLFLPVRENSVVGEMGFRIAARKDQDERPRQKAESPETGDLEKR
jgi:hypothetical protein